MDAYNVMKTPKMKMVKMLGSKLNCVLGEQRLAVDSVELNFCSICNCLGFISNLITFYFQLGVFRQIYFSQ